MDDGEGGCRRRCSNSSSNGSSGSGGRYVLRARRAAPGARCDNALAQALLALTPTSNVVVFSGSGLSASSGMSMFSTQSGLYERARKKLKLADGKKLFSYPFFKQRPADVQAFLTDIFAESQRSKPSPGHQALADLDKMGRLVRHYTMNIDGLAEAQGMDTWHWEFNPRGKTVEMHGNIRDSVCPECNAVEPLNRVTINDFRCKKPVNCKRCLKPRMRFKVMLYDDEDGDSITPEALWDILEEDLKYADIIVWVGISFQQSASVEYFRRVRNMLSSSGRLSSIKQIIVDPTEEPLFNLTSALSNAGELKVLDVRGTSDQTLPLIVRHLQTQNGTRSWTCSSQESLTVVTAFMEGARPDVESASAKVTSMGLEIAKRDLTVEATTLCTNADAGQEQKGDYRQVKSDCALMPPCDPLLNEVSNESKVSSTTSSSFVVSTMASTSSEEPKPNFAPESVRLQLEEVPSCLGPSDIVLKDTHSAFFYAASATVALDS